MESNINRKIITLVLIILSFNSILHANDKELIHTRKADFIIQIASLITFPSTASTDIYKLGIYGRGSEIRSLIDALESRGEALKINGKDVQIFNFKYTRNIEPVDLLYVSGDSKIRISDLNKKLKNQPYIMLTENFPFGTSMLNFIANKNDEIFFELQEEVLKDKGADIKESLLTSDKRVTSEKDWKSVLEAIMLVVKNQKQTIEDKSDEIIENKKLIRAQRITIIVSIIAILIIGALGAILLKLNRQRKEALKDVFDSISYAKYIQHSIMPSKSLFEKYFKEFFILYKPKSVVSGDFYWLDTKKDKILFSIADCTGHGVPGAMLSIMCSQSLTRAVRELDHLEPSKILDKVSGFLDAYFANSKNNIHDGMDLALCSLDIKNKCLEYAGAKSPLYLIKDGELKIIKPDRQSIGTTANHKQFTNNKIELKTGDSLYIFSDGYPDQFGGPNDKKFAYRRFRELLISIHEKPMDQQKEILNSTIKEWMDGQEQVDDISILGVKF